MRPTLVSLCLVAALAAGVDVTLSLTSSPAYAAEVDAGTQGGVATSPLVATSPALTVPPPTDVIDAPAAALAEAQATYQRSGLWGAVLFALWAIANALGKRVGPDKLLGSGRWASILPGVAATLGATFDALYNKAPNGVFVVLTTFLIAAAAALTPHVKHKDPAAKPAS